MDCIEIVKTYVRAWNERNKQLFEQVIHSDYHPTGVMIPKDGAELVIHELRYLTSCVSDWHYEIIRLIVDSEDTNKVWMWYRTTGTHDGKFFGFEPTGKRFSSDSCSIFTISEGKIIDAQRFYCFESILTEVGVVPPYWELHSYLKEYNPV